MKLKIYVINLKRGIKRRLAIQKKLDTLTYEYRFIEAVDGTIINEAYLKKQDISVNIKFNNPYYRNTITLGEIGCSLSHIRAWNMAKSEDLDYVIILEDDADLNNQFSSIIDKILNTISSFDMLYLGRKVFNKDEEKLLDIDNIYSIVKPNFSYWTIGYMLTKKGYLKLIESNFKNNLIPVDEFLPTIYLNLNRPGYSIADYDIRDFTAYSLNTNIVSPINNAFNESTTENSDYYTPVYVNNFYPHENTIQCVSVGTDLVDGLGRFIESCNIYGFPYKILGLNQNWEGNDLRYNTGGGHKINLLKKYLNTFQSEDDNRLILFTDSYDVVLSDNPYNIVNKFKTFDCDILFSAEPLLWPDNSLDKYFTSDKKYKYLNSGGFMGSIRNIKELINNEVLNGSDDQLYYQLQYINNKSINIKLDFNCDIFQTLSARFSDIKLDNSRLKNTHTDTHPSIIHGNGALKSKLFLNRLCNYINLRWRDAYGYKDTHTKTSLSTQSTIYVILFIDNIKNVFNIDNLFNMKYPKDKIFYNIVNTTGENIDNYVKLLNSNFKTTIVVNTIASGNEIDLIRGIFRDTNAYDYFFIGNCNHKIINYEIFNILLNSSLEIVGGMINGINNTLLSNYWGEISDIGYYKRSDDYLNIVKRDRKGYWNVPYISGSYIISKNKSKKFLNNILNKTQGTEDYEMFISRVFRENYHFMNICNVYEFGFILDQMK
tara:strand:+ start:301 stop:2442 length:2142 start_codon:yes stop_codon:yes gene_type:complete